MYHQRVFRVNGKEYSITELSKKYNITRNTLNSRIRNNPDKAVKIGYFIWGHYKFIWLGKILKIDAPTKDHSVDRIEVTKKRTSK